MKKGPAPQNAPPLPPTPLSGFTSSAGVSTNKLLSKVGSAMNKPNQQTVIPPRSVSLVMQVGPGMCWVCRMCWVRAGCAGYALGASVVGVGLGAALSLPRWWHECL